MVPSTPCINHVPLLGICLQLSKFLGVSMKVPAGRDRERAPNSRLSPALEPQSSIFRPNLPVRPMLSRFIQNIACNGSDFEINNPRHGKTCLSRSRTRC